jgi:site-specific DNA-methyltransferase (adenine-specific)
MALDLRNCDCMELMKQFPDKHFDLAIVDPPYGVDMSNKINSVTGGVKFDSKDWDKSIPDKTYFNELFRVSKNQIVWGGNYMTEFLPQKPCWIVWDKNNGDSLFADAELAWTSFDTPIRLAKIHWCGSAAIHETGANKIHPTQKPIKLYKWILDKYAKKNMKILDTHLGSGSIAIACHEYKFDLTGSELDTDYYNALMKRVQNYVAQQSLF